MLERKLSSLIRKGRLTVEGLGARPIVAGTPAPGLPDVAVRVRNRRTALLIALRPDPAFGEAYMDGALRIERGTLWDLLELCRANFGAAEWQKPAGTARRGARRLWRVTQQFNPRRRARRNAAHHYDLSDALFRNFLDADRQYSCAYFPDPGMTLEAAQQAKCAHIAAKLRLRPGLRVLDIGCGWGGLALYLARVAGVDVTGITLSREQATIAEQRVQAAGLGARVRIELKDYREIGGTFDRIVSVGMFEHVGVPHYAAFFRHLGQNLAEDGVALIHAIGRRDEPGATPAWTRKYIFPGGYIPALSEVLAHTERAGFWATDIEVLRLHYAETLRHWRERFLRNLPEIRRSYDERFCRMWEFFLATAEMGFRHDTLMVFQMQLAKRVDALPTTRDYMQAAEDGLRRPVTFPVTPPVAPR